MSVSVVAGFFRWWASELGDLLPTVRRRSRQRDRLLVLTPADSTVRALIEERGRREPIAELGGHQGISLSAFSAAYNVLPSHLRRLPVGIRVNASDCHERVVLLPSNARKDFGRLLRLDLERSTPLKADDLLSAHIVEGPHANSGMVRVRHLLLKRRRVEPLVETLRAMGIAPATVECWSKDGNTILLGDFLGGNTREASAVSRPAVAAMAAIALLLAGSALGIHWSKHERALSALMAEGVRLDAEVDEARRTVEVANVSVANLSRVRRLVEGRASTLRIIDEVTRLVPDTAWLEELRIEGDVIEIAGLATSATALLPSFERSPLFHESRFTAPLQLDHASDRERFRLRARLRTTTSGDMGRRTEVMR